MGPSFIALFAKIITNQRHILIERGSAVKALAVDRDATGYYKKTDIGLVVGAEVNLSLKLNIAVRFVEGFSVTTEPTYYIDEWKNRVIQISVGYTILSN